MQGEVAALITACCWTVSAMSFEAAGRRIGSLNVNILRMIMALVFVTGYAWLFRGQLLPVDADGHAWFWLSLSGLVGFTFGDLCLFRAYLLIGARTAMLMMALVPPMTALGGWLLLGEGLSFNDMLGMALTMGGVVLVVSKKKIDGNGAIQALPFSGILLGLGAAAGQAGGLALSKYGMGTYSPFAATQIRVIAGLAGFIAIYTLIHGWPKVAQALKDGGAMARVSLGAFFGPFLGVAFSLMAVQNAKAGVAATIMALTPVIIIAPTALIFKEKVTPHAIIGAVLAVAGVAVLFLAE